MLTKKSLSIFRHLPHRVLTQWHSFHRYYYYAADYCDTTGSSSPAASPHSLRISIFASILLFSYYDHGDGGSHNRIPRGVHNDSYIHNRAHAHLTIPRTDAQIDLIILSLQGIQHVFSFFRTDFSTGSRPSFRSRLRFQS